MVYAPKKFNRSLATYRLFSYKELFWIIKAMIAFSVDFKY